MGQALTALAYQGPAACAQQVGKSLEEASRWAGGTLTRFPVAARQALFDAVPLLQWCISA